MSCEYVYIFIDILIPCYEYFKQYWPLTNVGGWEGRDGIFPTGGRSLRLQARPQPHVRVHGQLHQKAQEPPREVHDEQCPRELHNPSGIIQILKIGIRHLKTIWFMLFKVITNKETQETLLCIAYVFEVSNFELENYCIGSEIRNNFELCRCPLLSMEPNTTSTVWWRTEAGQPGSQGWPRLESKVA